MAENVQPAQPPMQQCLGSSKRPAGKKEHLETSRLGGTTPAGQAATGVAKGAGVRRSPPQLRVTIIETIGELRDEGHRLDDGGYRIPFTEIWEKLGDRSVSSSDSDEFSGPDGKVVTMQMLGRIIREELSGKRVMWRAGGKVVRGYAWPEKIASEKDPGTASGAR